MTPVFVCSSLPDGLLETRLLVGCHQLPVVQTEGTQQARARQWCRIKKCFPDLSVSRKWECSWCSRSVRCVICSPQVGSTVSQKKCWEKSQTTTNVIQVPREGWVFCKIKNQIFLFITFRMKMLQHLKTSLKQFPPSQFVSSHAIYNLIIFPVASVVNQKHKCYNEQFPRHGFPQTWKIK